MGEIVEIISIGFKQIAGGGWLLILIGLYSIWGQAIIFERWYNLRKKKIIPSTFITRSIYHELERGNPEAAIKMCEKKPGPLTNVLKKGILNRHLGEENLKMAIRHAIDGEKPFIEKNLWVLSMLSSVSTYTGLLGTVLGIMTSFAAIQSFTPVGEGMSNQFSGGISQALITTAAGLVVALPCYVAYNYFRNRADKVIREMERHGISLVRFLATDEYKLFHEESIDYSELSNLQPVSTTD